MVDVEGVENPLRFPGQFFDEETGLHYNFHRYYDPKTGRYVSKDPIGFLGEQINLYGYVWNDPLNMIDPYGLLSNEGTAAQAIQEMLRQPNPITVPLKRPPKVPLRFLKWGGIIAYVLLDLALNPDPVGVLPEEEVKIIAEAVRDPKHYWQPKTEPDERGCSPDDFGRWCRSEYMKVTKIYSTNILGQWHASLQVEGDTVGWWPERQIESFKEYLMVIGGEKRNDTDIVRFSNSQYLYARHIVEYNACDPPNDPISNSIMAINMSIMVHSSGEFNYLNTGARNCAGWVCQVLSWAGWAPLPPKQKLYTPGPENVTCVTPGLEPLHLVPEGLTHPLLKGKSLEEVRSLIYGRYYGDLFVDWIF